MKSIRDLFHGEMQPIDKKYFYKYENNFEVDERKLLKTFNDEQKDLYRTCKLSLHSFKNEIAYKNFKCGFKMACRLIFDGLK